MLSMLKNVCYYNEQNRLLVRDNLILVFFCKCPFPDMVHGVKRVFDTWLSLVPKGVLSWATIGANADTFKPVTAKTITRCKALLDPAKAAKREMTAFEIQGPELSGPAYRFHVCGIKDPEDSDNMKETNLVEMLFPTEFLAQQGVDAVVELFTGQAKCLPYDSGYSSITLNWGNEAEISEAGELIAPLALRHPGYDVQNNRCSMFDLGRLSRGARWLTFLNNDLVTFLGGVDSLTKKLTSGVEVLEAGDGIAIRAGREPEIGDVNRKEGTPFLLSVAHAIEAVTFFEDKSLQTLFVYDPDKLERWERRFWD